MDFLVIIIELLRYLHCTYCISNQRIKFEIDRTLTYENFALKRIPCLSIVPPVTRPATQTVIIHKLEINELY